MPVIRARPRRSRVAVKFSSHHLCLDAARPFRFSKIVLFGIRTACFALAVAAALTGCAHKNQDRGLRLSSEAVRSSAVAPTPPPVPDLTTARRAVRAQPGSSRAHLDLGQACLAAGRIPVGAKELRAAARLDPRSQPAYQALADLYQAGGYLDRETDALRHLSDLGSADPMTYVRLGQIYMQLGWLKQAGFALQRAERLAPTRPEVTLEMARFEFERGQTTAAIHRLQEAGRRHSDSIDIVVRLAQYMMANRQTSEAEVLLRTALQAQPHDPQLEPLLAYCLLQIGDKPHLSEAVILLREVQQRQEQQNQKASVESYSWLGRAYERLERPSDAAVAYEHAVQLDPTFEKISYVLGQIYVRQGRRQEGARLLEFYDGITRNTQAYGAARSQLQLQPDDPSALRAVAAWDLRLQAYSQAIMEYKRLLALRPADAAARAGLSKALLATGRRTEARAVTQGRLTETISR